MIFILFLGAAGEYQTLLQQVTLPYVDHDKCETLLRATRLGEKFGLGESFNCAVVSFNQSSLWQYGLWSFPARGYKRKIFAYESSYPKE